MFKFDNSHIFTGYLKQLLSSVNLPTCRIYTREFAEYLERQGKEDPRVIESFDTLSYSNNKVSKQRIATRINYLKGNELYNYFWNYSQNGQELNHNNIYWRRAASVFYNSDKNIPGLTKVLSSPGCTYDTTTHEHLGEYLRFMRDYHNINLMSLYNCFNNKICNNIYYAHKIKVPDTNKAKVYKQEAQVATSSSSIKESDGGTTIVINIKNTSLGSSQSQLKNNITYNDSYSIFDSQDPKYRIYAFPVKLFADYTIAIDCNKELEMFCGLYTTSLDTSDIGKDLITRTYKKVNRSYFGQPFLYDKLNVKYWNYAQESVLTDNGYPKFINKNNITRWDIANREQDLKLFIKIPASCKSSITVLEGDFRNFNDVMYTPVKYKAESSLVNSEYNDSERSTSRIAWEYKQNHAIVNFEDAVVSRGHFTPIGKLQLLAFNTGESYPFADRLIEYLVNSAITPVDEIPDNIKRAQKVMSENQHYFKIDGIWEDKMQKIIYDYLMNTGPVDIDKSNPKVLKLKDKRRGYHSRIGHTSKSTLYDVLGYVDKDAEKWYASWTIKDNQAKVKETIQNADIYNGLWDI